VHPHLISILPSGHPRIIITGGAPMISRAPSTPRISHRRDSHYLPTSYLSAMTADAAYTPDIQKDETIFQCISCMNTSLNSSGVLI